MSRISTICLIITMVCRCYAMENDALMNVERSLVATSQLLDAAYAQQECRLCAFCDSDAQQEIEKRKQAYQELAKKKDIDVEWTARSTEKLDLSDKQIKTLERRLASCITMLGGFSLFARQDYTPITELDVSHNKLRDVRWDTVFTYLPCVKKLILSHNKIEYISTWGCNNSNLLLLDVSHNRLTHVNLCDLLISCKNLEKINLSHNCLTTVECAGDWSLNSVLENVCIDVSHNNLSEQNIGIIQQNYLAAIEHRLQTQRIIITPVTVCIAGSAGYGMGVALSGATTTICFSVAGWALVGGFVIYKGLGFLKNSLMYDAGSFQNIQFSDDNCDSSMRESDELL